MGQEFSKLKLQRKIADCVSLNHLLKYIFRGVSVHIVTGTLDSSEADIRYLLVSKYGFSGEEEESRDLGEVSTGITKILDQQQFFLLTKYITELHKLFLLGATLEEDSSFRNVGPQEEECPICMEVGVEIVLPCTHSFCAKCYEDWKSQNPTCPFCREDIVTSLETGGDESWTIEDCDKDMNSIAADLFQTTLTFLRALPNLKRMQKYLRTYPPLPQLQARREQIINESEAPESRNDDKEEG
jgi:hypothetical protein